MNNLNLLLYKILILLKLSGYKLLANGDWGLGIGDWAQSPNPNPQSPIPTLNFQYPYNHSVIIINSRHI